MDPVETKDGRSVHPFVGTNDRKKEMATKKNSTYYLSDEVSSSIKKAALAHDMSASELAGMLLEKGLGAELDKSNRPCIIPLLANKGGAAKTTTSVNLAAYMAQLGKKVLLIDLDGQANASRYLGFIDVSETKPCIADVLVSDDKGERMSLDAVMCDTEFENIKLIPSSFRFNDGGKLMDAETGTPRLDSRLQDAIEDMDEEFDYIFIDCPPSLGTLATNAIGALDAGNPRSFIMIPVPGADWAVMGLKNTIRAIDNVCRARRTRIHPWYCVKTICEVGTVAFQSAFELVKEEVGEVPYMETIIPRGTMAVESGLARQPLAQYDKNCKSKVAKAYKALTQEVFEMTGGDKDDE